MRPSVSDPLAEIEQNREENAKVEDSYGREKALQQDWHRKDQAGPDEDAAHPYVEGAKDQAEAGQDRACFRR
jgi:hypothetical protein